MKASFKTTLYILLVIVSVTVSAFVYYFIVMRSSQSIDAFKAKAVCSSQEGECEGLQFIVITKYGQIADGDKIMHDCMMAICNCGSEAADLRDAKFAWKIEDSDYGEFATADLGKLSAEDVMAVNCRDIFGSEGETIHLETGDRSLVQRTMVVELILDDQGVFKDEWDFNYVSGKWVING